MTHVFLPIEKGYECPDFEDCSKCPYHDSLCIIYGKEGKKRLKELQEELKTRSKEK